MTSKQKLLTATMAALPVLACSMMQASETPQTFIMIQASETPEENKKAVQYILFKNAEASGQIKDLIKDAQDAYAGQKTIRTTLCVARKTNLYGSRFVAVSPWARLGKRFVCNGERPSLRSLFCHSLVSTFGVISLVNQKRTSASIVKLWQPTYDKHVTVFDDSENKLTTMIGTEKQHHEYWKDENKTCVLRNAYSILKDDAPQINAELNQLTNFKTDLEKLTTFDVTQKKFKKFHVLITNLGLFLKTNRKTHDSYKKNNKEIE